jgi:hypothetical protein
MYRDGFETRGRISRRFFFDNEIPSF